MYIRYLSMMSHKDIYISFLTPISVQMIPWLIYEAKVTLLMFQSWIFEDLLGISKCISQRTFELSISRFVFVINPLALAPPGFHYPFMVPPFPKTSRFPVLLLHFQSITNFWQFFSLKFLFSVSTIFLFSNPLSQSNSSLYLILRTAIHFYLVSSEFYSSNTSLSLTTDYLLS